MTGGGRRAQNRIDFVLIELIVLRLVAPGPADAAPPLDEPHATAEADEAITSPQATRDDPQLEPPTQPVAGPADAAPSPASPDAGPSERAEAAVALAPAPAAAPAPSVDPAFIRAELLASRLLIEPAFTGVGLLVAAGISTAVTVGSGVGLAFIHHGSREECWDYGDFTECYLEPRSWAAQETMVALLVIGSIHAASLGISAGLVKGRYDAWATWTEQRTRVDARPLLAAGAGLLGTGAALGVTSATLAMIYWEPSRALHTALPLMAGIGMGSLAAGAGLVAYSGMYTRRLRRIERLTASPIFGRNRNFGLGVSGAF
jgi:hypothetical protein